MRFIFDVVLVIGFMFLHRNYHICNFGMMVTICIGKQNDFRESIGSSFCEEWPLLLSSLSSVLMGFVA